MLELGGKSAAVILDDMDIETAARTLLGPNGLGFSGHQPGHGGYR